MSVKTVIDKIGWPVTGLAVIGIGTIAYLGIKDSGYAAAINDLYQQAQADHRAEYAKRILKIKQLEAAQTATAKAYLARIQAEAAAADEKIQALKWKSNADLKAAKASADEILAEKGKVEAALTVMTGNRDQLLQEVKDREKQILFERSILKTAVDAAVTAKQAELDTCEKARIAALGEAGRKTWFTVGPGVLAYYQAGKVQTAYGVSLQIPMIKIKSPFKSKI